MNLNFRYIIYLWFKHILCPRTLSRPNGGLQGFLGGKMSARRASLYEPVNYGYGINVLSSMPPWTPAHWRAGRPQRAMKPAAAASSKVLLGS